mmetsp:Transcript_6761/g.13667  ORF Transcript_6761/g.13667 Transcript_6761/m.13667 type:complete len:300 (+) Transcript_6761:179-1078(+)
MARRALMKTLSTLLIFTSSTCLPSFAFLGTYIGSLQHHKVSSFACYDQLRCLHNHDIIRPYTNRFDSHSPNKIEDGIISSCPKEQRKIQSAPEYSTTKKANRRKFLNQFTSATIFSLVLSDQSISDRFFQPVANALDNPLNLKGTFWETGQLYEKSNNSVLSDDPPEISDLIKILETTRDAFHSPSALVDAISEGRYGDASRLLRGGLISESKIRLVAYALIDSLPEDDENEYLINELFRVFLRYLDALDAAVEAASRPSLGAVGGSGDDPRIKLLSLLGEVEDKMNLFVVAIKKGLGT